MHTNTLEAIYRDYIRCLNERRLDEMPTFYPDELTHNGERMTRARWRAEAIEATFEAMPDFQWNIQRLLIQGDELAARLVDTGTLAREWRGLHPTGASVHFAENVFYRFRDGRIHEVWSVIDFEAIQRQLMRRD